MVVTILVEVVEVVRGKLFTKLILNATSYTNYHLQVSQIEGILSLGLAYNLKSCISGGGRKSRRSTFSSSDYTLQTFLYKGQSLDNTCFYPLYFGDW